MHEDTQQVGPEECKKIRYMRKEKDIEYWNISYLLECSIKTTISHAHGCCDCNHEEDPVVDKPWAERRTMIVLFKKLNLHFTEIGEILGCHQETSREWIINRHELCELEEEHRTSSKKVRELQRLGKKLEDDVESARSEIERRRQKI